MKDIEEKKGVVGKKRKVEAEDDSEQFVGVRKRLKITSKKKHNHGH